MKTTIPYGRQSIEKADINAVVRVLCSDFLTQGPKVPEFERKVSDYCCVQHAVAVNSATSALHIACLALGVGRGDIVWTTPITFVASANCALYCGASVDFVDIDSCTYNMSTDHLQEKLVQAEKIGKLPKVVIPVHLCGQSCDMVTIHSLSEKYGFRIIEDASHAIGGCYKNESIGNCRYCDITVFSFHPVKIITTGEGGMALTQNAKLAEKMKLLRCHGITNNGDKMSPSPPEELWNYQQIDLGFNYRMTDICAALGVSQMNRLDEFVERRHTIANRYNHLLSDLPVVIPFQDKGTYSSFHLYVIRLKTDIIKKNQREIYETMHASGIGVNLHYIPIYLQPYYEQFGFSAGYCLEAEQYFSEAITLPLYPGLQETEQDKTINVIRGLL